MTHLYELASELRSVLDSIESEEGEVTPESIEALDRLGLGFDRKVRDVGLFMRELAVQAEAIDAQTQPILEEYRRGQKRALALRNKAERLRGYLARHMELTGRDAVKSDLVTVRLQEGQWKVECELKGEDIPDKYRIAETEYLLDRALVLRDYHQGEPLPEGIRVTRGKHLRIY